MFESKELEYCKLQVFFSASPEEIAEKEAEVLNAFKKAPVPKFRKGKADLKVIKHYYKDQINESVKRALVEYAYHKFLFEQEVQVYGQPQINNAILLGKTFTSEFVVHVLPKFELGAYKNLNVAVQTPSATQEDLVQEMLQNLRMKHADRNPFTDESVASVGDQLLISYKGAVDGVDQPQLTSNSETMVVGKSSLPSFDQQLVGMKVGETKEFVCNIPSEGFEAFANKDVTFTVTVHSGTQVQPCPLDNTLADRMNKDSLDQLREELVGAGAGARCAEAAAEVAVDVMRVVKCTL
jgi:trigger factor